MICPACKSTEVSHVDSFYTISFNRPCEEYKCKDCGIKFVAEYRLHKVREIK
jgi:transposase-like protein